MASSRCAACGGNGAVLVYILASYDQAGRRNRGSVVSSITTDAEANFLRARLPDHQELFSAARECDCVAMARARRET